MSELATRPPLGKWRVVSTGILVGLCATVFVVGFLTSSRLDMYAWDFRGQYLGGARRVVAGEPLYVSPDVPDFKGVHAYVYPPLLAVGLVPLTALTDRVATVVATVGCLLAVLGALALVGMRDVRCYLAVLASAPTWQILETANVTALLMLGVALAWRFRATAWPLSCAVGLTAAAKMFLWPLVVWVAATTRFVEAVRAVAIAVTATLCAWAVVGFQGLLDYPALARRLYESWAEDSYSIVGIAAHLGLSSSSARLAMIVVGGSFLFACGVYGRRGDDLRSFTCAIGAALALTPIAWIHYILLLLVPLAVARPRFSAIWLLPLVTWLVPRTGNGDGIQPFLPAAVALLLVAALLSRPTERAEMADAPA